MTSNQLRVNCTCNYYSCWIILEWEFMLGQLVDADYLHLFAIFVCKGNFWH